MATSRYTSMGSSSAQKHDEKLEAVELHLLDKIQNASSASGARDWAEAYALIRGQLTSTTRTQAKG